MTFSSTCQPLICHRVIYLSSPMITAAVDPNISIYSVQTLPFLKFNTPVLVVLEYKDVSTAIHMSPVQQSVLHPFVDSEYSLPFNYSLEFMRGTRAKCNETIELIFIAENAIFDLFSVESSN